MMMAIRLRTNTTGKTSRLQLNIMPKAGLVILTFNWLFIFRLLFLAGDLLYSHIAQLQKKSLRGMAKA